MSGSVRSASDVLQDIIGSLQEIVRSEVDLVKTELREEASKAKPAVLLFLVGGLAAVFATLFLLLAIVYMLSIAIPNWAAAMIVALSLALVSAGTLSAGRKRLGQGHLKTEHRIKSVKENWEWVQQRIR